MRSSRGSHGGKSGGNGNRNYRGAGNSRDDKQQRQPRGPRRPQRPREYEARLEEAARARHAGGRTGGAARPAGTRSGAGGAEQDGVRLQKVLAQAGLGSRRACEELIDAGRVEVNGQRVREQGLRVDPDKDEIRVDGLTVTTQGLLYFALNKPAGVVSTMEDPEGRQCLGDYVTNRETRLFHVGRLDTETEGLILLTNDGELANRLMHPRYGVTKTYLAGLVGPIPRDLGKRLREGVVLEDGLARADHFRIVDNVGKNYLVEISLHEGRKHIVRRMLDQMGFPVERLVRTKFGPLALGDQKSGWLRRLTQPEVGMLKREVGM
ncbi:pseudouridine synthase [Allostreptomyces psammosilenae]|uniref:Pseudouridine synthase n=1 Tax=Allostreptomyces psammosilenae TaxID=1892865 RepID=A0A852ZZ53_9ACTN|nr:pseudouridine synthase [Allostreptomyces psammosilenae]NYI03398.1 23S rRNA pseudouridine2605 synthase [Allostreptomyces psammosilenae]